MTRPVYAVVGAVLLAVIATSLVPGVAGQAAKGAKEDLCAHSFHSFLCNPTKNAKRRPYDGRRADNSNVRETIIKPNDPNLEGDNSNDDPIFQGPGYLPPTGEPRKTNLFGDGSYQEPAVLKPTTTTTRRPTTTTTTTRRPTTTTTTTRRPTTTTTTTRRPTTTTTTTTRRPTTTTTTTTTTRRPTTTTQRTTTTTERPRTREYLPPPPKETNLVGGDSSLDQTRVLLPTTTQKTVKENLCAHAFHSFLCDSGKQAKKQRRIYNGQRTAPENTNILGENSFQQPSRLLPPTTSTTTTTTSRPRPPSTTYRPTTTTTFRPRPPPTTTYRPTTTTTTTRKPLPHRNLIPDNTYLSPAYLPPAPKPTPKPTPDPEVAPDAAQNPSVRVKPDGADADLCKHSFHSFLCDSSKRNKQRRIYNGRVENSNQLGADSIRDATLLRPSKQHTSITEQTATSRPYVRKQTYDGSGDNGVRARPNSSNDGGVRAKPSASSDDGVRARPDVFPDGSSSGGVRARPDFSNDGGAQAKPDVFPDGSSSGGVRANPDSSNDGGVRGRPDVFPDGSSSGGVRSRPESSNDGDASARPDSDPCSHGFHSFQCGAKKTGGRRRVYDGQHSTIVGANSYREAKRVRAPAGSRRLEAFDTAASTYQAPRRRYEFASSNVDETHVAPPATSKPIPASLARLNPPTTTTTTTTERHLEEVEPAAAEAPSVVAAPDHHHDDHHHDDHHHDDHHHGDHAHAAATDHAHGEHHHGEHGHGDHGHGDHHHHHHNITLEQLCRDPFHAFLCDNVDTSKRRVYDGNPVQDSPSSRERQQLLGANSQREARKVAAPSAVKTVEDLPKPVPLSYLQQRSQFPATANPLTFDVTTYVKEPSTTTTTTTTTTSEAPVPKVVQTKYINPDLHEDRATPPPLVERRRRPVEPNAPTPTQGTFPGERVRRPLRRRQRPDADAGVVDFRPTASVQSVPEFINRRSDEGVEGQEEPRRRVRFGEKVPRRKRLPTPDAAPDHQPSPGEFVRGPRGAVRALAANMEAVAPDARCQEPFQAFHCGNRARREAKEDERRTGNMRGAAQGHEVDEGAVEEVKVTEKVKRVKVNKRVEQKTKVAVEEDVKGVEATTEDQYVVYQRGIEEEKKRREEEEENRKEELKRREVDLKNRKEELKRREKEQERRKVEDRKRKEDLTKKKIEEAERKEALKKLENEEKLEDDKEDRDDKDEEEEDDKEDELLSDYEKSIKAEEKRRAEEAKRREEELVRREEELKRREAEEKRRLAEAERRKVHDKLVEEELERRKVERVRVAEELVRRQKEDDRRTAAKLEAEALAKAQADSE